MSTGSTGKPTNPSSPFPPPANPPMSAPSLAFALYLNQFFRTFGARWSRQIDLGRNTHDHFISPEERLDLAMARQ